MPRRAAERGRTPARSDNDNYIVDCHIDNPFDPRDCRHQSQIPGVLEHGLF
jgi:ribose 5-phosphate isomerase